MGIQPLCKMSGSKNSSEGQEDDASSGRKWWEQKGKPDDDETSVRDGLQKPARIRLLHSKDEEELPLTVYTTSDSNSSKPLFRMDKTLSKGSVALALIFHLFLTFGPASGELSQATKDMVEMWAPKLWIHHEEKFRPSNVEYFLENTRVEDQSNAVVQGGNSTDNFLGIQ